MVKTDTIPSAQAFPTLGDLDLSNPTCNYRVARAWSAGVSTVT